MHIHYTVEWVCPDHGRVSKLRLFLCLFHYNTLCISELQYTCLGISWCVSWYVRTYKQLFRYYCSYGMMLLGAMPQMCEVLENVFTSNQYLNITTCTVLLSHWTMSSKTMKLKYHNTHMSSIMIQHCRLLYHNILYSGKFWREINLTN